MSAMTGKRIAGARRTLARSGRKYWDLYLLLIPVIVYFFVFKYLPMYGLQIAFRDFVPRKGFLGSNWVGLKHFIRFFTSYNCWSLIWNTLPIVLALVLNEMHQLRVKKLVQTITYAPHFLSTVVVVGMVVSFTSPSTGIVNTFIKAFGGEPIYFMSQARWFRPLYVISEVWKNMGWNSIIFMSALAGVDVGLYEAAKMDGANRFKQMLHVTLPSIMPTIAVMLILNAGKLMSVGHEKVFLMQVDTNLSVSQVISTYVYSQGIKEGKYSYASAIGMANSLVNFVLVLLVNGISRRVSEVGLW